MPELPRGVVDIDGALFAPKDARLSVFDRGVLYGDSAFEVMRTYGGRPFRKTAHLERLLRSCERLRISVPLGVGELAARVERAIAACGLPDCYVRVVVTRGVGTMGLDLGLGLTPSVIIYALELHIPAPAVYEQGITVGLVHTLRTVDGTPAAGAKTSNYLASMLALDAVKSFGAQEALILDAAGDIVEGATSNLFIVRDGALATPPVSAGILVGITRETVFELAVQLGLRCDERSLRSEDLLGADEAFITSSIREIVAVVRADKTVIGRGAVAGVPGPVTRRLLAAYRAEALRSAG